MPANSLPGISVVEFHMVKTIKSEDGTEHTAAIVESNGIQTHFKKDKHFFFKIYKYWDKEKKNWFPLNSDTNIPDIVCECGNASFILVINRNSLDAQCSKCHKSQEVYS